MGSLKGTAWGSRSFFHSFNPCWFLQPEVVGTYLPGTGTLGWEAWCGAETLQSWNIRMSLPNFYPPHVGEGPACSTSAPLLTVWMDVVNSVAFRLPFNLISDGSE